MPYKLSLSKKEIMDHFDTILREIVKLEEKTDSVALGSLTSARQYVPLYETVVARTPKQGRVLDWGCGNGHFSYFLKSQAYIAHAYAFGIPSLVDSDSSDPSFIFRQGDPKEPVILPYESAKFDTVVSVGVLEHVREFSGNEEGSLREFRRILKPGGHFVCFHFPNKYSWIEFAARALKRFNHLYRYSDEDIENFAKITGFELVEHRRYGMFPRNIFGWPKLRWLTNTTWFADVFDFIDRRLSRLFRPIVQNHMFVFRNPG
jgi:SAM-dependent methyltransferase